MLSVVTRENATSVVPKPCLNFGKDVELPVVELSGRVCDVVDLFVELDRGAGLRRLTDSERADDVANDVDAKTLLAATRGSFHGDLTERQLRRFIATPATVLVGGDAKANCVGCSIV